MSESKPTILRADDFKELLGAAGAAVGLLKAAAESAAHATPEYLKEIAVQLEVAVMSAAKNSDAYDPLPVGFKPSKPR